MHFSARQTHYPKKAAETWVGFPPPLLGEVPVRLPLIAQGPDWWVLAKPAPALVQPDPWHPHEPDLAQALHAQLAEGKPELQRLGVPAEGLRPVFALPPDIYGLTVWTAGGERTEAWRNAYGSGAWRLRFIFLARAEHALDALRCDLPLARHRTEPRVLVSHRTGKQSETQFRRRMDLRGGLSLWEAEVCFYRWHQIRVHAAESGLRMVGDAVYARLPWSDLNRRRPSRLGSPAGVAEPPVPLPGPAMALHGITWAEAESGAAHQWEAPESRRWAALARRWGFSAAEDEKTLYKPAD